MVDAQGNVIQELLGGMDNIQTLSKTDIGNGWLHFEQQFTVDPSRQGLNFNVVYYVNDAQTGVGRASSSMLIDNVGISYQVVCFARGTLIETNQGPVSVESHKEILSLFPKLDREDPEAVSPAARHLSRGRQGRRLAARHHKNRHDLGC